MLEKIWKKYCKLKEKCKQNNVLSKNWDKKFE
jgi:hypothetical protein